MTDLPDMKIKTLVMFPANIIGGDGIEVTKERGAVTIDLAHGEFPIISAVPTSPTNALLTYDTATGAYANIPTSLLGGAVAGISDAPIDSVLYGRRNAAWEAVPSNSVLPAASIPLVESGAGAVGISAKYAREDHVHPLGGPDMLGQGGTSPIAQSVAENARHQVFVTQFAACAGNDAVDDSVGINNAIDYLYSLGGGSVIFNSGDMARIKNPIILKPGVYLCGSASGPRSAAIRPDIQVAHIRAAANLTAMVTTADTTVATHSSGLIGMVIDANRDNFTVDTAVKFSMLNSRIENCQIEYGTGHGVWNTADSSGFAWINWIVGNSIGYFTAGVGIMFDGTDSVISGNYISSCVEGVRITGTSNVRVVGNHFEICSLAGLRCVTPEAGASNVNATPIVGNTFTLNAHGIVFIKGSVGTTGQIFGNVIGNFFNQNTYRDVYVDAALTGGMVGENSFLTTPTDGNVEFANVNCTGWVVDGSPTVVITGGAPDLKTKYAPWRPYTPVVSSVVGGPPIMGTITAAYQIDGRRCFFRGSAVVTTVGSASNRMLITLPVPCRGVIPAGGASGFNASTGVFLSGLVGEAGKVSIAKADSSFPAADGNTVAFSGWFEIA